MTDILEHFFYEDQKPSEHTVLPYRSRLDSSHQTQISEKKHCAGIQCLHTSNHYSRQIRFHILHIDRLFCHVNAPAFTPTSATTAQSNSTLAAASSVLM